MAIAPIPDEGRRQPATLYRLRERCLNDFELKFPRANGHQVAPGRSIEGFFYAVPGEPEPPGWLPAVTSILPPDVALSLFSLYPGGVLLIQYKRLHFVFTFGHAWSSLKDEWVEPHFGMRVALNAIPRDQLTELKAEQVFAAWHLSSERAPAPSSVAKFGLEVDRDLVHAIEGKPTAPIAQLLGATIRGGVSLKISIDFLRMNEVLDLIISLEQKTDYKQIWPEIDNLTPVRDAAQVDVLNQHLDAELSDPQKLKSIMLVAPTLKNSDAPRPSGFLMGRLPPAGNNGRPSCPYLLIGSWASYLNKRQEAPSVATAKSTTVHFLDDAKEPIRSERLYNCIGFETAINSGATTTTYVLSAGQWYEASTSFIDSINRELAALVEIQQHPLNAWNSVDDEGVYNASCIGNENGLYLFDAKNIHFGGGRSKFEFCDLLHAPTKTLYFVKHVCASNHFSHLSEQVRRTVELVFGSNDEFRQKLVEKAAVLHPGLDTSWLSNQRPKQGDAHLCIVSMGKHHCNYPFFAKCGLARLVKELRHANHNVSFITV